jgi:hypothetical protein
MHSRIRFVILAAVTALAGLEQSSVVAADVVAVDLKDFKFKVPAERADLFGYDDGERKLFYYTSGAGEVTVKLPADGEYEIVIRASDDPALGERAKFKVKLDDEPVGMETLLTADDEKDYKLTTPAKMGERKLSIEFTNDVYKEGEYDRNFYVHEVALKRVK